MSTIKISQLTEKPTMVGTEEVLINDSGTSKKFSTQRFLDVKTACETSETNASNSAVAAAASAASAASVYDSFDDRYLGVKASDPTLDNDGDPLVQGMLYFDSTNSLMKVYDGSAWITTSSATLATLDVYKFTATAGQTIFTGLDDDSNTLAIKPTAEIVFINGVAMEPTTDYTVTATTLTLVTGAALNDEVNVYAFGNFELADHYNKTISDARYYTQTQVDTSLAGKSDTSHNHSGVYEPADATILKDADIGVTVQAYDADTAKTDVVQTFTAAQTFNGNTTVSNGQVNLSNGYGLLWGNTAFYGSDATGVEYLRADVNGAEAMRIDTSGKVGIGTSSPNQLLHVNGASEFTGTIYANSNIDMGDNDKLLLGNGDDLQIYHNGTDTRLDNHTGQLVLRNYSDDKSIYLQTDDGLGGIQNYIICDGSTETVKISSEGVTKLETTSTGVTVTGSTKTTSGFNLFDVSSGGGLYTHKGITGAGTDLTPCLFSETGMHIKFYTNGNAATERMRLETNGDLHADGDVIAYSTTISDKRLKEDIKPIENALDKVSQLNGCTFTYTEDGKQSAGLIAQDVEKVLPSAVSEKELPLKIDDGIAYKTVQYDQTIGLLVEAVKELTARVEELEAK